MSGKTSLFIIVAEALESQVAKLGIHWKGTEVTNSFRRSHFLPKIHRAWPLDLNSIIDPDRAIRVNHQKHILERGTVNLSEFAVDEHGIGLPDFVEDLDAGVLSNEEGTILITSELSDKLYLHGLR